MPAAIPLKRSEMKRLADFAKREGVRAEVEFNGFIFRVAPDHAPAKVDDSEESALARELAEFDRKHGYS
ncbi:MULTISPECIES: hypothetical protein [unclassified Shinella]|uniref:hypothetical protein n=1 Tax=unclassified Shinella TaxID=2643062 RepID=UPI00234E7148|nr:MULTISPECIES: hypothetical protein [unclassified Shinella]MCO5153347.1 hypothetical protein [Shinella sp.]MDC7260526.1 hypothetical protein [Shinella sp. HY16]MDC7267421.1 hypothetical protein [Shinella sp. YZ44]